MMVESGGQKNASDREDEEEADEQVFQKLTTDYNFEKYKCRNAFRPDLTITLRVRKAEILDNQVYSSFFVLTKRHFVLSGGPSHRQAPRSSSPEAASATLGGLLATVREQDSSTNAFQGSPRDRGSSRNSSNSYRASAPNMYGRQEYDHHRSEQQSYRGNGGHKHPRIEHPGDWR
ncbi:hypothetical protein CAEBREN_04028 [Caenorhabditis brenneri]|uniref:Uncharacterized protein n=1 Tax=Caenorhabditis brenneri TaxID=135651 RepID=G0P410_CAEBE|nr:hypothetical protein CAEBREN_04028 [Caenorhabditis brenneri]